MIKKITRAELEDMNRRPLGKKHAVRIAIEQLQPGEIITIDRTDFKWKGHTPKLICNQITKKTKVTFLVSWLADKSGWIVERVAEQEAEEDNMESKEPETA